MWGGAVGRGSKDDKGAEGGDRVSEPPQRQSHHKRGEEGNGERNVPGMSRKPYPGPWGG